MNLKLTMCYAHKKETEVPHDCQRGASGFHINAVRPPLRLCLSYAVLNLSTSSFIVLWEKKEVLHIKRCMGNNIMKAIKNKFNSMPFKSINFSQTPHAKPQVCTPLKHTGIKAGGIISNIGMKTCSLNYSKSNLFQDQVGSPSGFKNKILLHNIIGGQ